MGGRLLDPLLVLVLGTWVVLLRTRHCGGRPLETILFLSILAVLGSCAIYLGWTQTPDIVSPPHCGWRPLSRLSPCNLLGLLDLGVSSMAVGPAPLKTLAYEALCPHSAALSAFQCGMSGRGVAGGDFHLPASEQTRPPCGQSHEGKHPTCLPLLLASTCFSLCLFVCPAPCLGSSPVPVCLHVLEFLKMSFLPVHPVSW